MLLTEWAVILLIVLAVLAAGAAYRTGYQRGETRGLATAMHLHPPADEVYDEVANLRHIVAQLKHGPAEPMHEHIWPREPDTRKMGWHRYKCVVANCPALRWDPS